MPSMEFPLGSRAAARKELLLRRARTELSSFVEYVFGLSHSVRSSSS